MHAPTNVAEMTAYLAEYGRRSEPDEWTASARIVSVNSVDESDAGSLVEVLEWLAAPSIAARQLARVGQERNDDRLPRAGVTRGTPTEQRPEIARRPWLLRGARMRLHRHPVSLGVFGFAPTGLADGLAIDLARPLRPEHRLIRPKDLGSPPAAPDPRRLGYVHARLYTRRTRYVVGCSARSMQLLTTNTDSGRA
jgi:hypothetical protein